MQWALLGTMTQYTEKIKLSTYITDVLTQFD